MQEEDIAQTIYPRILFNHMEEFRGRKVTLIGTVCKEDNNGSLVIECGPSNYVIVDNQRKADLNDRTQLVEIRGIISSQNMVTCEELTEFEQKEPFDFDTYGKFVQLSLNDKLRFLFQEV